MPKSLYFTAVFFFCLSFLRRLISEVTERISTKLGHIHLRLLFEKFGPNSQGIYPQKLGQKPHYETDLEL